MSPRQTETPDSALKCACIADGLSSWSRSKLHICLNGTIGNETFYNATIADACMSFDYNGNIGIANQTPIDDGGTNTFFMYWKC